jgi:hypothetical protein
MKIFYRKLKSRVGEKRIIKKFLWFPTKINDELRWLEDAEIEQTVRVIDVGGTSEWGSYDYQWCDTRWADREEEKPFVVVPPRTPPPAPPKPGRA